MGYQIPPPQGRIFVCIYWPWSPESVHIQVRQGGEDWQLQAYTLPAGNTLCLGSLNIFFWGIPGGSKLRAEETYILSGKYKCNEDGEQR